MDNTNIPHLLKAHDITSHYARPYTLECLLAEKLYGDPFEKKHFAWTYSTRDAYDALLMSYRQKYKICALATDSDDYTSAYQKDYLHWLSEIHSDVEKLSLDGYAKYLDHVEQPSLIFMPYSQDADFVGHVNKVLNSLETNDRLVVDLGFDSKFGLDPQFRNLLLHYPNLILINRFPPYTRLNPTEEPSAAIVSHPDIIDELQPNITWWLADMDVVPLMEKFLQDFPDLRLRGKQWLQTMKSKAQSWQKGDKLEMNWNETSNSLSRITEHKLHLALAQDKIHPTRDDLIKQMMPKAKTLFSLESLSDENICLTRGASEAIDITIEGLADSGGSLLISSSSYGGYVKAGKRAGLNIKTFPGHMPSDSEAFSEREFSYLLGSISNLRPAIIMIANPSNLRGNTLTTEKFELLLTAIKKYSPKSILVIDAVGDRHASQYYPDYPDYTKYIENNNLVVINSASKSLGLSGARVGIIAASQVLLKRISTVHTISVMGLKTIEAIIDTSASVDLNRNAEYCYRQSLHLRERIDSLAQIPFKITTHAKAGNFFIFEIEGRSHQIIYHEMKEFYGIHLTPDANLNFLRVTIDTEEHNEFLFLALQHYISVISRGDNPSAETAREFKLIRNQAHYSFHIRQSINFADAAFHATYDSVLQASHALQHNDLPKEAYRNYAKSLAKAACSTEDRQLAHIALTELCLRIQDTAILEESVPGRDTAADYFQKNVADTLVSLREQERPVQHGFTLGYEVEERTGGVDTETDRHAFAELAFFRDSQLPFRPAVVAEALAAIALRTTGGATSIALEFLNQALFNILLEDGLQNDSLKASTAKGLSKIVIYYRPETVNSANSALYVLMAGLCSKNRDLQVICRESILKIVGERSEIFFEDANLAKLLRVMENNAHNSLDIIQILENLALNARDKLVTHTAFLSQLREQRPVGTEQAWKYFEYYLDGSEQDFPVHKFTLKHLKTGAAKCLIVHNIKEAVGDEWARNSYIIKSLLLANPDLTVTILTDRPYLYNHPNVIVLPIKGEEAMMALKAVNYSLVINQFYSEGTHSVAIQEIVKGSYRQRAPIYFETASASNYYSSGYLNMFIHDGEESRTIPLGTNSIENVYAAPFKIIATLGLPLPQHRQQNISSGVSYPPADNWWEKNITQNPHTNGRKILAYHPFGGTYEDKGHTRLELDICAAEIVEAIQKGYHVIVLPGMTEWSNAAIIKQIVALLPDSMRDSCTINVPDPIEDTRLQLHLLSRCSKVICPDGGIGHMALDLGIPVDIVVKFGRPENMWLPYLRAENQRELSIAGDDFHKDASNGSLENYLREFMASPASAISNEAELRAFIRSPEKLCQSFHSDKDSFAGNQQVDISVPQFINAMPQHLRKAVFQPKLMEGSRAEAIFTFLKECFNDRNLRPEDITLLDVKDYSTGRALVAGHVVYKIDFEVKRHGIKTIYLKGYGTTEKSQFERFAGWENRPRMSLYEEFFAAASSIVQVSEKKAKFCHEPEDTNFIGFTLIEAAQGRQSDLFFYHRDGKTRFHTGVLLHIGKLVTQLANWHAFSELLGRGDRRFLNLSGEHCRPSNYFMSNTAEGELRIESIDHELLFRPDSLSAFEQETRLSELATLLAFPPNMQENFFKIYKTEYIAAWNSLLSSDKFDLIYQQACKYFGYHSVETAFLSAMRDRNPEQDINSLWASMKEIKKTEPQVPATYTGAILDRRWRQEYSGKTVVIKFSGKVVGDEPALRALLRQAIKLKQLGARVALIHGGGDQIDEALTDAGVPYSKTFGVRHTSAEGVGIVENCLTGLNDYIIRIFKEECAGLHADVAAIGTSGFQDKMIIATTKFPGTHTGEVETVNKKLLESLTSGNLIPIINPVCAGNEPGKPIFNVNADEVGAAVAKTLGTDLLIFCSNTFIMDSNKERMPLIRTGDIEGFVDDGTFRDGVVIKLRECRTLLETGMVETIVVLNGRDPASLENELFGDKDRSTKVERGHTPNLFRSDQGLSAAL